MNNTELWAITWILKTVQVFSLYIPLYNLELEVLYGGLDNREMESRPITNLADLYSARFSVTQLDEFCNISCTYLQYSLLWCLLHLIPRLPRLLVSHNDQWLQAPGLSSSTDEPIFGFVRSSRCHNVLLSVCLSFCIFVCLSVCLCVCLPQSCLELEILVFIFHS